MSQPIDIQIQGYNRSELSKTIDTQFTQLIPPVQAIDLPAAENIITVPKFFTAYNDLFYLIPKTGETNSHEYLIKQSGEYVGGAAINADIVALQQEITQLRQENLDLQQTILTLQSGT